MARRQNPDASLHADSWTDAGQSNQDRQSTSDNSSSFRSSDGISIAGADDDRVFDRASFRKTLVFLKPMLYVPNNKLAGDYRTAFHNVAQAIEPLKSNPEAMRLINTDIRSVYGQTNKIIPGTLSAYFLAQKGLNGFSGPAECDPKYIGSLNHTDRSSCKDRVLIYDNEKFGSIHECNSDHAYIYLAHPEFSGFTPNSIQELKQAGITKVTLIYSDKQGAYKKHEERVDVHKLPTCPGGKRPHKPHKPNHPHHPNHPHNPNNPNPPNDNTGDDGDGSGWWWVLLVVVAILLIGLAIWWLCRDRRAVVCCVKCNDNPCRCPAVVQQVAPQPVQVICEEAC